MPEFVDQSDKSLTNPSPKMDLVALSSMTQAQGDALAFTAINSLHEKIQNLENRLKYFERYESNPMPPVRQVVGDSEFIFSTQTEEHVLISFDDAALRASIPQQLYPDYVDEYQHCDADGAKPNIYLPSGIADGNAVDGVLVIQIKFVDGEEDCYVLLRRNVLGALTPYVSLSKIDDCEDCQYHPPTDPPCTPPTCNPPTGDYPLCTDDVVVDVDCAQDGTGDLFITYMNVKTCVKFVIRKTLCCCENTYTPPTPTLDRWRPCGLTDDSQDIFLHSSVYDGYGTADPVIRIRGNDGQLMSSCCFALEARGVTGETETAATQFDQMSSCSDSECEDCEPPVGCVLPQPGKVRISGWTDDYFGSVGIWNGVAICYKGGFVPTPPVYYDGTFPNRNGDCQWENDVIETHHLSKVDPGENWWKITTGAATRVYLDTSTNPDRWVCEIGFTGSTYSDTLRFVKAGGQTPVGTYTFDGDGAFTEATCFVLSRTSITIEEY